MKPATSLPWSTEHIGVSDAGPNGEDVFDIGPCDHEGAMRKRVATVAGDDAAYIVHACNAYPRLVKVLEAAVMYGEGADIESMARDLLRELGELK